MYFFSTKDFFFPKISVSSSSTVKKEEYAGWYLFSELFIKEALCYMFLARIMTYVNDCWDQ